MSARLLSFPGCSAVRPPRQARRRLRDTEFITLCRELEGLSQGHANVFGRLIVKIIDRERGGGR
jgi:hypothetical protein